MGAWECLARGIDEFGKPDLLLSDNSLAFGGKLHNQIVLVEKNLIALGIKPITSRPYHRQTGGKNERGHQTLQKVAGGPTGSGHAERAARVAGALSAGVQQSAASRIRSQSNPLERRIAAARHTPIQVGADQPTLVRHCTAKTGRVYQLGRPADRGRTRTRRSNVGGVRYR
jgi:hypothetical protein